MVLRCLDLVDVQAKCLFITAKGARQSGVLDEPTPAFATAMSPGNGFTAGQALIITSPDVGSLHMCCAEPIQEADSLVRSVTMQLSSFYGLRPRSR